MAICIYMKLEPYSRILGAMCDLHLLRVLALVLHSVLPFICITFAGLFPQKSH